MRRSPSAKSFIFSTNTSGICAASSCLQCPHPRATLARRDVAGASAFVLGTPSPSAKAQTASWAPCLYSLPESLAGWRAHLIGELAQWFHFGERGKNDGDRGQPCILPIEADIRLDAGRGLERALDRTRLLGTFRQRAGHFASC